MPATLEAVMELLLAAYRDPLRYQERLKGPLPTPFHQVLRLAMGKTLPAMELFCQQWKTNPEELRKAAVFFIEQACLGGKQDPYRVLGLSPGAESHRIQAHYRLLMLLFHPDRNEATANWRDVYAAQLSEAYHRLRNPANRQAYERKLAAQGPRKKSPAPIYDYRLSRETRSPLAYLVLRFPWAVRYLPQLILGGGVAVTLTLVANLYFSRTAEDAPAVLPVEGEASSRASPSPQKVTVEPLSRIAQRSSSLVGARLDTPSQPTVKPAEQLVAERDRPLETAAAYDKQAIAVDDPEALRAPLGEDSRSRSPRIPALPAKPPPASPALEIDNVPATDSGGAAMEAASSATAEEAVSAEEKHSAAPAKDRAPAPARSLRLEAVQNLLWRFIATYRQGDLEGFLALFSPDANTSDYSGRAAIRQDYTQLFASTEARDLQLLELEWFVDGNTATGIGRYIARIRKANDTFETRGQIFVQVQNRRGTNRIIGLYNTVDSQRDVSTPN